MVDCLLSFIFCVTGHTQYLVPQKNSMSEDGNKEQDNSVEERRGAGEKDNPSLGTSNRDVAEGTPPSPRTLPANASSRSVDLRTSGTERKKFRKNKNDQKTARAVVASLQQGDHDRRRRSSHETKKKAKTAKASGRHHTRGEELDTNVENAGTNTVPPPTSSRASPQQREQIPPGAVPALPSMRTNQEQILPGAVAVPGIGNEMPSNPPRTDHSIASTSTAPPHAEAVDIEEITRLRQEINDYREIVQNATVAQVLAHAAEPEAPPSPEGENMESDGKKQLICGLVSLSKHRCAVLSLVVIVCALAVGLGVALSLPSRDDPSSRPAGSPSVSLTISPSPSFSPTLRPTTSPSPTLSPTITPRPSVTIPPSILPTYVPSASPSFSPTFAPTTGSQSGFNLTITGFNLTIIALVLFLGSAAVLVVLFLSRRRLRRRLGQCLQGLGQVIEGKQPMEQTLAVSSNQMDPTSIPGHRGHPYGEQHQGGGSYGVEGGL